MPRQKSGKLPGRPRLYSDEDRPVNVSVRIPHDLAEQTKRYAALRRQSVSELLLDGLKWRIGEGDPRGFGMATAPLPASDDMQYYGNIETPHGLPPDTASTALLEEIRTALACQATQLHTIAQAILPRCSVPEDNQYLSNTEIEHEQPETVEQPSAENRQPGNVPAAGAAYDPTRFQLGALCKRGHTYGETGQSLRELRGGKVGECAECHRERARASQAKRQGKQGAGQ